jgi:hypothetical protein
LPSTRENEQQEDGSGSQAVEESQETNEEESEEVGIEIPENGLTMEFKLKSSRKGK